MSARKPVAYERGLPPSILRLHANDLQRHAAALHEYAARARIVAEDAARDARLFQEALDASWPAASVPRKGRK